MSVEAITGDGAIIDSCTFDGDGGDFGFAIDLGVVCQLSNSNIAGCQIRAVSAGYVTITGCVISTKFGGTSQAVMLDASTVTITGCVFQQDASIGGIIGPDTAGSPWATVTVTGNSFYGGFINLGSGPVDGLVVANNSLYGPCDLTYDSSSTARIVRDVSIHGNVANESFDSPRTNVHFLGTNLSLERISIVDNVFNSPDAVAATSMIHLQPTRAIADNGLGIRIADNMIQYPAGGEGYAVRVQGSTGSLYGHVVVDSNTFHAAGMGVLVKNIRDVTVSNNVQGITSDTTSENAVQSNQLTVQGAVNAIVDGNKWIAGEAGNLAGTNSVVYVQASGSGAVRNNDIWGRQVGSTGLNTVMSYSTTLTLAGNVYHGLHTSQTGSTFTNGFVTI